jgi:hypothetical protein
LRNGALWFLAAVAGGTTTWVALAFGVPALPLLLLAFVWATRGGRRLLKAGGVLTGAGLTAASVFVLAALRCSAFTSQVPGRVQSCTPTEISPFLLVGLAGAVMGVVISIQRSRDENVGNGVNIMGTME